MANHQGKKHDTKKIRSHMERLAREASALAVHQIAYRTQPGDIDLINANLAAIQALAAVGETAKTLNDNLFSEYMALISRLAKETNDHANAMPGSAVTDRARAMILTRDLRTRLYTLCYYVQPDKPVEGGNPTKAQAKAAADGILEVATQIEELLGVNRG